MSLRSLAAAALALCALGASATAASADIHYLSPYGTDAGDCTSPEAPCGHLSYVQDAASPGDTIDFGYGDYWQNAWWLPSSPLDTRTITKANLTLRGAQAGVHGRDHQYPESTIMVEDINGEAPGLTIAAPGVTIDGLRFQWGTYGAAYALGGNQGGVVRNTVVDNTVSVGLLQGNWTIESSKIVTSGYAASLYDGAHVLRGNDIEARTAAQVITSGATLEATGNRITTTQAGFLNMADAALEIHGNHFLATGDYALMNFGTTTIDAEDNFWNCNGQPGDAGCPAKDIFERSDTSPYLVVTPTLAPNPPDQYGTATFSATLKRNSAGVDTGYHLPGTTVTYEATRGSFDPTSGALGSDGVASTTWQAPGRAGAATLTARIGNGSGALTTVIEGPDPSVSPTSVAFGEVVEGQTETRTVTLSNGGTEAFSIYGTGVDAPFTYSTGTCGSSVVPGESCELTVSFAGSNLGARTGRLTIATSYGLPFRIPLSATGVTPPVATLDKTLLDFGAVAVGRVTAPQVVTLTNTGGSALQIGEVRVKETGSTLFDVEYDSCSSVSLPVGESCSFEVQFAPRSAGTWVPRVQIPSNVKTVSVRLRGSGVVPLLATPGAVDFGTVGRTTTGIVPVTLTNQTDAPIAVDPAVVEGGTGRSQFKILSDDCAGTLAAGAECQIDLAFTPTAVGEWSPALRVPAATGAVRVPLHGIGVPVVTVTPDPVDFGSVPRNTTSAPETVTVTNHGAADATVQSITKDGTGRSLFAVDPGACAGATLETGESCTFAVTFSPLAAGTWSPKVVVATSARTTSVTLSGTGVR